MELAGKNTSTGTGRLRLHPFRGLRYNAELVGDVGAVTSPPYDVMDRPMIERLLARHPRNIVRLVLPRLVAEPMHTEDAEAHAAKSLQRWSQQRVLVPDREPALYVYEYGDEATTVCGLIGALELRTPSQRTVLPHEDVIPDIVADRLAMMSAAEANLEPILLVYDGGGATADILAAARERPPLLDVSAGGGADVAAADIGGADVAHRHRLWAITDAADLRRLQESIASSQALIADGHHRYATYLELRRRHRRAGDGTGPWDRGLVLLIDSSKYPLQLGAIHRSLVDVDVSLDSLSQPPGFELGRPEYLSGGDRPATATRRLVLVDRTCARTLLAGVAVNQAVTDAELLHAQVLPAWRVSEDQLSYHHTVEQAVRAAQLGGGIAILLHPARLEQVLEVARGGAVLPRKSTSFGPKPRTGLVMRRFADDP